jgi:acetylornithine aminotransferase
VTTSIAEQLGQADIYAVNLGPGDPQYAHRDARDGGMRSKGAMVHLSRGLRASEPYPFEELDRRKAAALADGRRVVDFGVGDPREETPEFIRQALKDAIAPTSSYPRAAGLPELRAAIASWVERRFGAALDPDVHILPTLGTKEPIFSLAQSLLDPEGGKQLVAVTSPGYTIPERGARFAGGDVTRLSLTEANGFLPNLHAVDASTWDRTAILWLNYPNNPTGATAPLDFLKTAADHCRSHDVVLASDEAYCELWFEGEPPASALQVGNLTNVLVFHTLSKRSSMTGYRSGFLAGDPEMIAALRALRPSVGVTPQEFVQRASVAAWNDEAHVEETRAAYARKRKLFLDLFASRGIRVAGSVATFYLWVAVPAGRSSLDWSLQLLEDADVIVAPGSFLGQEGEGFVRMAMVPTIEECERAAEALDRVLEGAA